MARRRQRTKRVAFGCLGMFLIMLAVGVIGAYAYVRSIDAQLANKSRTENPLVETVLTPKADRKPGAPFYMLLVGKDARPDDTTANSDTLIVAHIDPPNKRITLLSIPRDTRVSIPGHGKKKINAAMQLGEVTLAISTVKEFTGLPIDHYLEIDFNGFKDLVDAIGGVWVDVPHDINDSKAANHDWRAKVVKKGYQKLDGPHALTFVRSRKLLGDDYTRIKDQQVFIKALAKQTLAVENVVRFPAIVSAMTKNVTTDLDVGEMMNLAADFKGMDANSLETVTAPGEAKYIGGVSYVISDDDKLAEIVRKIEAGESVEKHEATSTPAGTTSTSGTATTVKASSVTISVRNGAGGAGLAAEVAAILKRADFPIEQVGNTARPVYDKTLIVFKDNDAEAKLVHDTLGFGTAVHGQGIYTFSTDVLVIVGKDWREQSPKATSTTGN
jgi:polyisoprenyl-teichoic acid--peptidoglycan teichoic acid transferase